MEHTALHRMLLQLQLLCVYAVIQMGGSLY